MLSALSGLIPARAGNTNTGGNRARRGGAHPRSRGEHLDKDVLTLSEAGSSPLARGTHRYGAEAGSLDGLIPARAGNTVIMSLKSDM